MADPERGRELPQKEEKREAERTAYRIFQETVPSERHPERNEDALLINKEKGVFGVFDGVSSGGGGEVASRLASQAVEEFLSKSPEVLSKEEAQESVEKALQYAHQKIEEYKKDHPEYAAMSTTASAVKIYKNAKNERLATVGHVGDSRIYVLRKNGELAALTLDDNFALQIVRLSYANELEGEWAAQKLQKKFSEVVDLSSLTPEEQYQYSKRNIITQAVGSQTIKPFVRSFHLEPGDVIVLTSDGAHDNETDSDMERIIRASLAQGKDAAQELVAQAQVRSRELIKTPDGQEKKHPRAKKDDMSALVVELEDSVQEKQSASAPQEKKEEKKASRGEVKDLLTDFSRVLEWSDLFSELKKTDGVIDTSGFHPRDEIMSAIRKARIAAKALSDVTSKTLEPLLIALPRIAVLRQKIADLIQIEEVRRRFEQQEERASTETARPSLGNAKEHRPVNNNTAPPTSGWRRMLHI